MSSRRTPLAILVFSAISAALPLWADAGLPVGLVAEPSGLLLAARAALAAWGAFLLAAGGRFPRTAAGTFFLLAALPAAWTLAGGTSGPLALILAWAAFGLGMLLFLFLPRAAMALALCWPLAALYVYGVISTGSFSVSRWIVLSLAVAGAAFGAAFPKAGLSLLAPALGLVLLRLSVATDIGFGWTAALLAGGFLLQGAVLPLLLPRARRWDLADDDGPSRKRRAWGRSCAAALAVLAAAWISASLFAPFAAPGSGGHPDRAAALDARRALGRPGLLLSAENAFYVAGRALPVSIVARSPGFSARLRFLTAGRSLDKDVSALRAVKSGDELALLRKAAAITSRAFEEVAPLVRPGANEGDIERALLASFRRNGATGLAFRCVVGSGANATKPHYEADSALMDKGLVVIDVGCSYDHYASDMTRTFPVRGTYTPEEKRLVGLVAEAESAARARLRAGATLSDLDAAAREVIDGAGFGKYFNHGIGHGVGLDVHDPSPDKLVPGMVVTIEPGVYVPAGSGVDPKYWDLGVRIENTFVVTKDGYEQITSGPDVPVPLDARPEGAEEEESPHAAGPGPGGT